MTAPRTIYIASPDTEQGLALARLFCAAKNSEVRGALLPGESGRKTPLICVDIAEALADPAGQVLPTGIRSTTYVLQRGSVDLGATTFAADSLRTGDKSAMLDLVDAVGVPAPRTWTDRRSIPSSVDRVFYKESHEQGGGRRGILSAGSDLGDGKGLIFQEYIDSGGTYGVAFVAHQGSLLEHQAHFERFSAPWTGGSAVLIERVDYPELVGFTERIVSALEYSGWGLAEFKWSPDRGEFVFMEVNSKLWASCEFTFRANPRFFELITGGDSVTGPQPTALLFVHRLLTLRHRQILTVLRRARGSTACLYPGMMRPLLSSRLPKRLKARITAAIRGTSGRA